jgi:hypothetical protein
MGASWSGASFQTLDPTMTSKSISLTSKHGSTARYRAKQSGREWCVYRITFGWLGDSYQHVGCASSLQDAIEVAKADADFVPTRTDIR